MSQSRITKKQGIQAARTLKMLLQKHGIPVQKAYLFGSVAKGTAHLQSDIDIAIVHEPFANSRNEEIRQMCRAESGSGLQNIEVLYFYPDDLDDKYSTIAQEVKRHGIAV
jgi:uncharacterized protein